MKIAVIYQSKYGTTKRYATWIAESLEADLIEKRSVKPDELLNYDVVIYGGALYAGGILGVDLVTKKLCKKLIIFTVGLANPDTTDYTQILDKGIPSELRKEIKFYHLRGGIDYKKLGVVDRFMMAMMKRMSIGKRSYEELSHEERAFLDTYGNQVNFTDKQTISPIIEYVKRIASQS